jgi:hypothetical protein
MAEGEARPRVIADVSSYEEMLDVLRARVRELQVNGERFDEYAGLPRGYFSKLVGAKPIRRLGMTSFEPVLAGLGLRLQIIEDQEATERLKSRVRPRNGSYARRTSLYVNGLTNRQWLQIQKLGRKARWKKLNKQQRSAIMRAVRAGAAIARWQK